MLRSAEQHLLEQRRFQTVGAAAAQRAWRLSNPRSLLPALIRLQTEAARAAITGVAAMLAEQNITAPTLGQVDPRGFAGAASDGRALDTLLDQATTMYALELMALTQIADAGRVAAGVAITARHRVGWTRMVNPPCCPRCAILAGKYFKWNQGFQRHPNCDCRHIPTQEELAGDVRTDPKALFDSGQVHGVTQAEQKAIKDGADINQVINARRSLYMDDAGRQLTRDSTTRRGRGPAIRYTPEEIYRQVGDDQAAAIRALKKYGYLF